MTASKTEYLNLRLDEQTKNMLKAITEKDSRSITKEIEWLIKQRYEQHLTNDDKQAEH